MKQTKKAAALGLSISMVGLVLGSFGSGGLAPAGATTSAFDQAVADVAANKALTTADVTALKAQVRSVLPNTTDQFFNAAFYAYAVGQPQYVRSLPTASTTDVVANPTPPSGGALSVDTDATTASYAGVWRGGFTVTRNFFGLFTERLASFHQHVDAIDANGCMFAPDGTIRSDTSVDVTGNGSYGGWYFDRYNDVRQGPVKWNGCAAGEWDWHAQALFRQCVAGYCNAWDPWITQRRFAAGPNTDADWSTDHDQGHHYLTIGIRVA